MLKKYMARSLYVKNGLSSSMSRSFKGHNVCEYEVNLSTNEKVITEKHNFNTK